jgi:hypothetical protein
VWVVGHGVWGMGHGACLPDAGHELLAVVPDALHHHGHATRPRHLEQLRFALRVACANLECALQLARASRTDGTAPFHSHTLHPFPPQMLGPTPTRGGDAQQANLDVLFRHALQLGILDGLDQLGVRRWISPAHAARAHNLPEQALEDPTPLLVLRHFLVLNVVPLAVAGHRPAGNGGGTEAHVSDGGESPGDRGGSGGERQASEDSPKGHDVLGNFD